jgi:hypothetical protein
MLIRLLGEAIFGSGLSIVDMRTAVDVEKKVAGGRAMTVRSMISRQMLMALTHRKMKEMKQARS